MASTSEALRKFAVERPGGGRIPRVLVVSDACRALLDEVHTVLPMTPVPHSLAMETIPVTRSGRR